MNNRGLAAGILKFLAVLAFFALMYGVLNQFVPDLFGSAGLSAQTQKTTTLQSYMQSMWVALPAIVAFAAALRLIARAVFESKGGAR